MFTVDDETRRRLHERNANGDAWTKHCVYGARGAKMQERMIDRKEMNSYFVSGRKFVYVQRYRYPVDRSRYALLSSLQFYAIPQNVCVAWNACRLQYLFSTVCLFILFSRFPLSDNYLRRPRRYTPHAIAQPEWTCEVIARDPMGIRFSSFFLVWSDSIRKSACPGAFKDFVLVRKRLASNFVFCDNIRVVTRTILYSIRLCCCHTSEHDSLYCFVCAKHPPNHKMFTAPP